MQTAQGPAASRLHLKLRGKLTLTYLAVGLALTSIHIWSTRWLQQRAEDASTERTDTVQMTEDLADLGSGAFEEGFAYVLSGDPAEKAACLGKLEQFSILRARLIARAGVREGESAALAHVERSAANATLSARRIFEEYDHDRVIDRKAFGSYEASMDRLADELYQLTARIRRRAAADDLAADHRLDRVLLGIAGAAALLAVAMGAIFGLHLTRPLLRLRAAAARFGRGDLEVDVEARSQDEFGEVTTAFSDMARNIRGLLATVAEQKRHLEDVFASLGEMLLVCAPDGSITSANHAVCATLGYREDEIIGRPLELVLDSLDFEELQRLAMGRDTGGVAGAHADRRMRRKDGRYVVVAVSASLLRTNDQQYAGVICVAQDLSDRRRLEAELRQAQKLQAIGRLASGVAHEINTPVQFVSDCVYFARDAAGDLTRIIDKYQAGARAVESGSPSEQIFVQAHELERASNLPYLLEKLPSALERSIEGLDRITAIVRSMKVFAHPGQAQMVPVDLNRAVESTLMVAQSEYKHIAELVTDFEDIPKVTCHSGEINQAVLNLVINAAHAISEATNGETKGRIGVRTRREGDSVVISVSDTGSGIPAAIREHIFEPFFTTKEVGKGTGQGLSAARSSIVDKHRGQLTFETEPGKGTTFHIRLPIGGAEPSLTSSPPTTAAA